MEIISTIIGLIFGFLIAVLSEPFRKWLFRAKLNLEFTGEPACRTTTRRELKPGKGVIVDSHTVRIKVTNTKRSTARDCRGYLTNVERRDSKGSFEPTVYCDSLALHWSCRKDFNGIDIPKGINQYLDVVATKKTVPKFEPQVDPQMFRYRELWKETGTFRLTVMISADNAKPELARLVFEWKGNWDNFEVSGADL